MALEVFQQMLEEEHLKEEPETSKYWSYHIYFTRKINFSVLQQFILIYFLLGLADTEELLEFLADDQEAEIQRSKISQAETCKLAHDTLQMEWGRGEVVPHKKPKN